MKIYAKSTFPQVVLEYNFKKLNASNIPSLEYFFIKNGKICPKV